MRRGRTGTRRACRDVVISPLGMTGVWDMARTATGRLPVMVRFVLAEQAAAA